ncbi:MAG: tetraacyldisaccharide 4'-kinase [candidate division KSB1 bacterium]|nr:tetraacyldisaccharide 4'-kinase [candidate division KSB1 bacterium]MDZ7334475.1 tetraacyldisaccharide 4'-kinase [candidate division KSB1 bacterium]MDZ7356002.1 tetraacyldisaccharide 4'-kinase [candidate division KSB1 bacterium]MDZ7376775.1 tetraacyldisaccharide 4'-kinase [candidate division KSB1 bacterium]MDZ7400664.1 tetraacyldisaccharide 4'-kinase [candidate division KSB1 bacterium]
MNIFKYRGWQRGLLPLSLLYGLVIWIRNRLYDKEILRSIKIENCQIISVGNISVGGTGKTPVISFLAKYLAKRGFKVAVLSRGYGRKSQGTIVVSDGKNLMTDVKQGGDEPYLLARQLPTIPVVVEADRVKGAEFIQQNFHPDFILLDDGFQHRRLKRNLDIVLIDASVGFGSGYLLPAGFLREPISSLSRADLIWLSRVDQAKNLEKLIQQIRNHSQSPIITSIHQPAAIVKSSADQQFEASAIREKRVLLFSGIANPLSFERTVQSLGGVIVHHKCYKDHYQFTISDIDSIMQLSEQLDIDLILTTEKDFVRLLPILNPNQQFFYLTIEIRLTAEAQMTLDRSLAFFERS